MGTIILDEFGYDKVSHTYGTKQQIMDNLDKINPYEIVLSTDTDELYYKDNMNVVRNVTDYSKAMVEDTIDSLKSNGKYKIGDVVEVLGYYTKGDGSNHKRIISVSDNGSGVNIGQNLFANLFDSDRRMDYSNKTLGIIGDSIAKGADSIWDFLKEQLFFSSYVNYGIAGTGIMNTVDSKNFVTQSEDCGIHDVYFVWGGVNDYYSNNTYGNVSDGKEKETLCGRLKRIIYNLRQKNKKAKIYYISPVPYFGTPSQPTIDSGRTINDLSNLLKEVANTEACQTIELTSNLNFHKDIAWFYYTDLVHPNDEGRKVIKTYILQSLLDPSQHGNYGSINRSGDRMNGDLGLEILKLMKRTKSPRFNFYNGGANQDNEIEDVIIYSSGGVEGTPRRGDLYLQGGTLNLIFDKVVASYMEIVRNNPRLLLKNGAGVQQGYLGYLDNDTNFYIDGANTTFKMKDGLGYLNNKLITTSPANTAYSSLDTPYYTAKMQNDGVYEDFVDYMDATIEYNKQMKPTIEQPIVETSTYSKAMMSYDEPDSFDEVDFNPVLPTEPQPSEALQKFADKNLI